MENITGLGKKAIDVCLARRSDVIVQTGLRPDRGDQGFAVSMTNDGGGLICLVDPFTPREKGLNADNLVPK